jgi:hypothetical protein
MSGWRDSNPHTLRHQILSLTCLPISPHPEERKTTGWFPKTTLIPLFGRREFFYWVAKVRGFSFAAKEFSGLFIGSEPLTGNHEMAVVDAQKLRVPDERRLMRKLFLELQLTIIFDLNFILTKPKLHFMKIFIGILASIGFLWIVYELITGNLIKRPLSKKQKYTFYILLLLILAQTIVRNFDLNVPGF